MKHWFWLWLSLTVGPLQAEVFPAFYSVTGVAADDVLNLRARPDPATEILGTLAPDATGIEVMAIVDGWAVINTDGVSAYAAGRFLRREAGPDWTTLQQPLTCAGTEPFWSLAIDPGAGTAGFSTPDQPDAHVLEIDEVWPAEPWSRSAAVSLPVGMAVLRGEECSDGMSDQRFGIAVDLFLRDAGGLRLAGCCSLAPE
jgi:uncharacterized membrane protein